MGEKIYNKHEAQWDEIVSLYYEDGITQEDSTIYHRVVGDIAFLLFRSSNSAYTLIKGYTNPYLPVYTVTVPLIHRYTLDIVGTLSIQKDGTHTINIKDKYETDPHFDMGQLQDIKVTYITNHVKSVYELPSDEPPVRLNFDPNATFG